MVIKRMSEKSYFASFHRTSARFKEVFWEGKNQFESKKISILQVAEISEGWIVIEFEYAT